MRMLRGQQPVLRAVSPIEIDLRALLEIDEAQAQIRREFSVGPTWAPWTGGSPDPEPLPQD
jgi:hypothetical protein